MGTHPHSQETVKEREAWRAAVHWVAESDMTKLLINKVKQWESHPYERKLQEEKSRTIKARSLVPAHTTYLSFSTSGDLPDCICVTAYRASHYPEAQIINSVDAQS